MVEFHNKHINKRNRSTRNNIKAVKWDRKLTEEKVGLQFAIKMYREDFPRAEYGLPKMSLRQLVD